MRIGGAQVQHRPRSLLSQRSIPDNDNWSETETFLPADERRKPPEVSFRVHHRQPEEPRTPSESEYSTRSSQSLFRFFAFSLIDCGTRPPV